jgi:surface antigen
MNCFQRVWQYFQQHRRASLITGHIVVASAFVLVFLGSAFGPALVRTFALVPCPKGDQTYIVRAGDTLSAIGNRYHTDWQRLASHNNLLNPNLIFINQQICIPGQGSTTTGMTTTQPSSTAIRGTSNPFAFPQCTWWASERYHQLHGIFVPWTINSNAWQWMARAQEFHWRVSSRPTVGAIAVQQPLVQGASSLGHVGVVEKILANGHVMTSNTNWGLAPTQVTHVELVPGPGISFVTA